MDPLHHRGKQCAHHDAGLRRAVDQRSRVEMRCGLASSKGSQLRQWVHWSSWDGCGDSDVDDQPSTPPSAAATADVLTREEFLAELAVMYGIEDPPPVDIVREIAPNEEGMRTIGECLDERGWPVEIEQGGFTIYQIPPEQQDALSLDQYTCKAQYPVAPEYANISVEESLTAHHAYLVEEYVPCVAEFGFAVSTPPSLETFLAEQGLGWVPGAEVYDQVAASDVEWSEVEERCPQNEPID